MNARFEIMDFDSTEGNTPWCVVDHHQTGSDGEELIIGRYPTYPTAMIARDACITLIGPSLHPIDCDLDEDCLCVKTCSGSVV